MAQDEQLERIIQEMLGVGHGSRGESVPAVQREHARWAKPDLPAMASQP